MQRIADVTPDLIARLAGKARQAREHDATIAQREREIAELRAFCPTMVCPMCNGYGQRCEQCGGFGLVCPDCRGMRWVRRGEVGTLGHDVMRCLSCTHLGGEHDVEREQRAIARVFAAMRDARQRRIA